MSRTIIVQPQWHNWLNRYRWHIIVSGIAFYALLFAAAALSKYWSFWMGFDLAVHEQVLWNTLHGHIADISPKGATSSYLGVDIIVVELLLTPLYALAPRTETMLLVQVCIAASGALPLFLLAQDRAQGQALYGVLAMVLYFACLPVQYAILYEFQIRTVGTVLFLWAMLFFERKQFVPFIIAGLFAIWTRSDGSFALAAIGIYALLHRRSWQWVVTPLALGATWLLLCLKIFIPAFRSDSGFLYDFVFAWLGSTPLDMLHTMLFHPMVVASHMFTPEKLGYLFALFAPLLFLPVLRPDVLLIAVPTIGINLLSPEHIHWSIRYHYQSFVVPFLLIATIFAIIDMIGVTNDVAIAHNAPSSSCSGLCRLHQWLRPAMPCVVVLLLIITVVSQLFFVRSPLVHLITRPRDNERIAIAYDVLSHIPPDASVSATSSLGAHLARRRELFFFPGNIIYPPAYAERGDILVVDLQEVPADDMPRLQRIKQSGVWRTRIATHGFLLLERVQQNSP